ncbi:hypothetical protein [Owenweeksia hongkongensis]|uniref:hypothetical protein n=1 Tax=Owenweeksia hongkongensis TaxID=253245 RepID=UPI003A9076FF
MKKSSLHIVRWDTIISDEEGLYFEKLTHNEDIRVYFKNEKGDTYIVLASDVITYQVSDEEVLTAYWDATRDSKIGWTRILKNSELLSRAKFFESEPLLKHYLVATYDYCLEMICLKQPAVLKDNTDLTGFGNLSGLSGKK